MSFLNDCIKFHLNIEDSNIIFSDYFKKCINGKYHNLYVAELIQAYCPYCHSSNLKHNGHYTSNVRFITADASHPVTIRLKKQRVLCNDCLKRSMAQSKLINKGCYISNTSKRKILSALTEDRSMTCIASIDRFHMVQMLTRSFNIFRVQIMKQFNKSSREYRLLKSPWKLYLMRYDRLNRTNFKDYLTQEHVVLDSLDCDQTLENTYWVMQDFMVVLKELTVRLNKLNVLLMVIEILVIS